jgi:PAS domain S-box-containing protein
MRSSLDLTCPINGLTVHVDFKFPVPTTQDLTQPHVACKPVLPGDTLLSHAHPELIGADYVVFVDSSRRYMDCSDGIHPLLGYEREELLQKTIDDISYDDAEVKQLFKQYLNAGGLAGEYVLKRKDGTPLPIRYKSFVFSDGCLAAVWEPIHDWRQPYLAALLEIDPAKLRHKIDIALAAIQAHMLRPDATQAPQERQSIQDARSALRVLLKTAK